MGHEDRGVLKMKRFFQPGHMDYNVDILLDRFHLIDMGEVALKIPAFEVLINGKSQGFVEVVDGKYKSALLILFLWNMNDGSDVPGSSFHLSSDHRRLINEFFPPRIIEDALNNPNTKHTTVRDLLAEGEVIVVIKRP